MLTAGTGFVAGSVAAQDVLRLHGTDGSVTEVPLSGVEYVDFVVAAPAPADPDLGGQSNCYIVSEPGTYHFEASFVDGGLVDNVERATWLWREASSAYAGAVSSMSTGAANVTLRDFSEQNAARAEHNKTLKFDDWD